jgi:hypothetical protein
MVRLCVEYQQYERAYVCGGAYCPFWHHCHPLCVTHRSGRLLLCPVPVCVVHPIFILLMPLSLVAGVELLLNDELLGRAILTGYVPAHVATNKPRLLSIYSART